MEPKFVTKQMRRGTAHFAASANRCPLHCLEPTHFENIPFGMIGPCSLPNLFLHGLFGLGLPLGMAH